MGKSSDSDSSSSGGPSDEETRGLPPQERKLHRKWKACVTSGAVPANQLPPWQGGPPWEPAKKCKATGDSHKHKDKGDKHKGDKDKGDKHKGDKDKGDKHKGDKDKGDKHKGDKHKGEKDKCEKKH